MTRSITRFFFAATVGIVVGVALVTAAVGCGAPLALAVGIALLGAIAAGWRATGSQAVDDVASLPTPVLGLGAVSMAVTLVELARLAVFMIDPTQVAWSIQSDNTWRVRHSCVSAYWVACQEVDDGGDVYRLQRYEPPRDAAGQRQRIVMDGFVLDAYEYPPPFLVLPRLLAHEAPTFLRFRTLWFAVQLLAVAAGIVMVARWIGGTAGAIALTLSGFVLAPYGVMTTLQIGNAQLAFVALPMAAMVLFDRRRPALGGALLAYATVSKLYPALLVLYLLLRRDWRGAAWTIGLGVAIVATVARRRRLDAVSGLRRSPAAALERRGVPRDDPSRRDGPQPVGARPAAEARLVRPRAGDAGVGPGGRLDLHAAAVVGDDPPGTRPIQSRRRGRSPGSRSSCSRPIAARSCRSTACSRLCGWSSCWRRASGIVPRALSAWPAPG